MRNLPLLEISVECAETASAAERGGANRIELCAEVAVGGVTPGRAVMEGTRARVKIPIFAMIRPRAGNFVYSAEEFAAMKREMVAAREAGMDGFVLGLLHQTGEVDVERTTELVKRAAPLPVTFHRAFDECAYLRDSLEDVVETGATRILTSGGKPTAPEAWEVLRDLVKLAGERIQIMPGSGLHSKNIREAMQKTGAREYHAGLSSVVKRPAENLAAFEHEVRKMAKAMRNGA